MNKQRESGYYWVRQPDEDWEVARYYSIEGNWYVTAWDSPVRETEFDEINEERIKEPGK